MRMLQGLETHQCAALIPIQCDIGTRPMPDVVYQIDLQIIDSKWLRPVVILRRGPLELVVPFEARVSMRPFNTPSDRLAHFRMETEFSICQEDPRGPEVFFCLRYRRRHMEALQSVMALSDYLRFFYSDPDPADPDSSEIGAEDRVA